MAFDANKNPGGLPVQPWGMADTLFATGSVLNPTAGQAIATLTTPAAGTYRINVSMQSATQSDMELRKGASTVLNHMGSITSFHNLLDILMTLDGATSVSINATNGGVTSGEYDAQIIATRIF